MNLYDIHRSREKCLYIYEKKKALAISKCQSDLYNLVLLNPKFQKLDHDLILTFMF